MILSPELEIKIAKKIAQHRLKSLRVGTKKINQAVVALAYDIVNKLEVHNGTVR